MDHTDLLRQISRNKVRIEMIMAILFARIAHKFNAFAG
jgi:hypothetical protein